MKRILVDMSATILHHGHIRLLRRAAAEGRVVVALTSDEEIISQKGYLPELRFEERQEILESIKYVSEVIKSPWLIDKAFLEKHKIDVLVHGSDNVNPIEGSQLLVLPRTDGVSSTEIRQRALRSITDINNKKLMLTPGPAAVLHEQLLELRPVFGRADPDYERIVKDVEAWVKTLTGAENLVYGQGSATLGLELAARTFVAGRVLIIQTGYYSERLKSFLGADVETKICTYDEFFTIKEKYDWVMCAYTETSVAFKVDILLVRQQTTNLGAQLYVDATASIGLEDNHNVADVMAFSSCKGLMGLTGGFFISYKEYVMPMSTDLFYFNLLTHKNKMITGPYHAMLSLYGVISTHNVLKERVRRSKELIMSKFKKYISRKDNQPLLCTHLNGALVKLDENIVAYHPRNNKPGTILCHLGEVHSDRLLIGDRIDIIENK